MYFAWGPCSDDTATCQTLDLHVTLHGLPFFSVRVPYTGTTGVFRIARCGVRRLTGKAPPLTVAPSLPSKMPG